MIGKKKYIQAGILPLESQLGADAEGKGERGNYRTGLTLPFRLLFQQLHISTVSQWFIMVQAIKLCQKPQHKLPSALTWKQILFDIQGPKPSWKSGKKITHTSLNKKNPNYTNTQTHLLVLIAIRIKLCHIFEGFMLHRKTAAQCVDSNL